MILEWILEMRLESILGIKLVNLVHQDQSIRDYFSDLSLDYATKKAEASHHLR